MTIHDLPLGISTASYLSLIFGCAGTVTGRPYVLLVYWMIIPLSYLIPLNLETAFQATYDTFLTSMCNILTDMYQVTLLQRTRRAGLAVCGLLY